MKYNVLVACAICLFSCKEVHVAGDREVAGVQLPQQEYQVFGEKFSAENSLSARQMSEKYQDLKTGDTIPVKFTTTVTSVCKMKGCWMVLELPDTEEDPMVKFKDYGFFVPKDIEEKEVVVKGVAFIEETSVEDQKHFAEDGGRSQEEIDAISEPKISYGFLADGVLLKQ